MKRPAFQFYPGDWLRSTDLRSCSVGARGLWMDMICLMHDGNPYGYLKVGDKVIHPVNLAAMVGAELDQVTEWLKELEISGVFSRKNDCIICRRMIRDERIRESRAKGGILGGNPALLSGGKVNLNANLKPTPASAFAFASASKNKNKPTRMNGNVVELPDWLPVDNWTTYLAMRSRIRKPATTRAQRMLIGRLHELRDAGHNPGALIAQAELKCWLTFYPPKET